MGSAIGGGQSSKSPHGIQWADIRDFGADPTGANTQQHLVLQRAHDSLLPKASGYTLDGGINSTPGVVFIPAGFYTVDHPVWVDGDHVTIRGEGASNSVITCISGASPFFLGFKRRTMWNRTLKGNLSFNGPLTFTSGSATVTGTGTNFQGVLGPYAAYPRYVTPDLVTWYKVSSVNSDTSLTLTAPYTGTSLSTASGNNLGGIGYLETIPAVFAADHRFDLWNGGSPKLDSSLVSGPNQRFGLRSKSPSAGSPWPDHFLSFFSCPPGYGVEDCWETIQQFTLDLCIEGQSGGAIGGSPYVGMGNYATPAPWILQGGDLFNGQSYRFYFLSKEGVRDAYSSPRRFDFGNPSTASGPQRISIQLDLLNAGVRAWINGVEQTIVRGYGMQAQSPNPATEPSFTPGLHFQSNEPGAPFNVWNCDSSQQQWGNGVTLSERGSFSLYGLRLTNGLRYDTSGGSQVLASGVSGTLTDSFRYTNAQDSARLISYVDTTDPAVADYPGRLVTMRGGPIGQTYYGLFCPSYADSLAQAVVGNTIEDVQINSGSHGSSAVTVGPCLHTAVKRSKIFGGWHAVATSGGIGAVYDIHVEQCELYGTCSWVYARNWICSIKDMIRSDIGRFCLRFDGCHAIVDWLPTSNSASNNECIVKITGSSSYGTQYQLHNIDCDNEGTPVPTNAAIYAERSVAGLSLEIDHLNPGFLPTGVPCIKLADNFPAPPTYPAGIFRARDIFLGGSAIGIQTDGPGWEGTLDQVDNSRSSQWRKHTGTDGGSNVLTYHRMDGLPTTGTWQKHAHIVLIRHPNPGAAQAYLCVSSGTSGSGSPPTWAPIAALGTPTQ